MGVYVFQSIHGPYLKIGHYSKNNAWSRIAHRGFTNMVHPKELVGKVKVDDFELIFWDSCLTTKDEKLFHKMCKEYRLVGEWFSMEALPILEREWKTNELYLCSKEAACLTRRRL